MAALLRRYWAELIAALLYALPVVVLVAAGVGDLLARDRFLWWCVGSVAAALLAAGLLHIARRQRDASEAPPAPATATAPELAWSERERSAWSEVQRVAGEVEQDAPMSLDEIQQVSTEVVVAVAKRLHPDSGFAAARFTLPDVLLAVELGVADLRAQLVRRVPGADIIRASDLMELHHFTRRYGSLGKAVWNAYRAFRVVSNPINAAVQEVSGALQSRGLGGTWERVKGQVARALVEEVGRRAIDLYAGRLRVSAVELAQEARNEADAPFEAVPIRVALLGQANAGKSSLANALLGDVQAAVSELPTPQGSREFRLEAPEHPALSVVDTPGLDGTEKAVAAATEVAEGVDLVLWVCSAASPARRSDQQALQAIEHAFAQRPERKPPPTVLVVTHIDRLSPQREWSPPYNVDNPTAGKAKSIRTAIDAIRNDLPPSSGIAIPVALRAGEPAYNLDALWAAIASLVDEARATALHRALRAHRRFDAKRLLSQCIQGGRFVGAASLLELNRWRRAKTERTDHGPEK